MSVPICPSVVCYSCKGEEWQEWQGAAVHAGQPACMDRLPVQLNFCGLAAASNAHFQGSFSSTLAFGMPHAMRCFVIGCHCQLSLVLAAGSLQVRHILLC